MSARIAPEPISSGLGAVTDFRPQTARGDSGKALDQQTPDNARGGAAQPKQSQLPNMPPSPPPPGAAFAAALITAQSPNKPISEREIQLRRNTPDLPAQGSLALHDRRV